MFRRTAMTVALIATTTPVFAQVTGGALAIEYDLPTNGDDLGGTTYSGALEYAITRNISVGANLSGYRLDNIDNDGSNATVRGIYHLNDITSFGAFLGSDKLDGSGRETLFGIEAGAEFGAVEIETYSAALDAADETVLLVGIDGRYGFGNGFSAIGSLGVAGSEDTDIARYAFGAEYEISGGPQFYAEVGNVDADANGIEADQTFIGLGARVAFGANRGTTFSQRSLFEILPGF